MHPRTDAEDHRRRFFGSRESLRRSRKLLSMRCGSSPEKLARKLAMPSGPH